MGIPINQIPGTQDFYISQIISEAATSAFVKLLSECHLYQSVEIDRSIIQSQCEKIDTPPPPIHGGGRSSGMSHAEDTRALKTLRAQQIEMAVVGVTNSQWLPTAERLRNDRGSSKLTPVEAFLFPLHGIRLYCPRCKNIEPHNPGTTEVKGDLPAYVSSHGEAELHALPFQCQGCKLEPVTFFVVRNGFKLRLVGRTPMETVRLPNIFPEPERKHFSDAVLAYQSGQVLPAMFMLRTFIEQVWKRFNLHFAVKLPPGAITAEERGERYQQELPEDFKQRFPSLLKIYADMSAAMHDANADASIFQKAHDEIIEHFEARKLFKLSIPDTPNQT